MFSASKTGIAFDLLSRRVAKRLLRGGAERTQPRFARAAPITQTPPGRYITSDCNQSDEA